MDTAETTNPARGRVCSGEVRLLRVHFFEDSDIEHPDSHGSKGFLLPPANVGEHPANPGEKVRFWANRRSGVQALSGEFRVRHKVRRLYALWLLVLSHCPTCPTSFFTYKRNKKESVRAARVYARA